MTGNKMEAQKMGAFRVLKVLPVLNLEERILEVGGCCN